MWHGWSPIHPVIKHSFYPMCTRHHRTCVDITTVGQLKRVKLRLCRRACISQKMSVNPFMPARIIQNPLKPIFTNLTLQTWRTQRQVGACGWEEVDIRNAMSAWNSSSIMANIKPAHLQSFHDTENCVDDLKFGPGLLTTRNLKH